MTEVRGKQATTRRVPVAIDVFSGAGGLTLGLRRAGFRLIGAIEIDDLAVETYRKNHRQVRVFHRDIRKITGKSILRELRLCPGKLDLLAGCPPCQGFSSLRTRNGAKHVRDIRNDLLFEFLRLVRVLRPKAVMMENVPGLASNNRMIRFVGGLRRLGYVCNVGIFNAADYGVPQRRRRLILLASQSNQMPFARPDRKTKTVRQAIGSLPPVGTLDPLHVVSEERSERIRCMISKIPRNGGSRSSLPKTFRLQCHRRSDGYKDVYGRMDFDAVAPTITTGCANPSRGRFLHPTKNRTITLREAAMLQGFPRKYFFSLRKGKFAAASLIGNALPPGFVRRHASIIKRFLTKS